MSCPYCGMYQYHLSGCPLDDGATPELGRPIAQCNECGHFIYEGDTYLRVNSKIVYCADCMDTEDSEDVDEDETSDD